MTNEEKKDLLCKIEDLGPEDKSFVLGFAAGVSKTSKKNRKEKQLTRAEETNYEKIFPSRF